MFVASSDPRAQCSCPVAMRLQLLNTKLASDEKGPSFFKSPNSIPTRDASTTQCKTYLLWKKAFILQICQFNSNTRYFNCSMQSLPSFFKSAKSIPTRDASATQYKTLLLVKKALHSSTACEKGDHFCRGNQLHSHALFLFIMLRQFRRHHHTRLDTHDILQPTATLASPCALRPSVCSTVAVVVLLLLLLGLPPPSPSPPACHCLLPSPWLGPTFSKLALAWATPSPYLVTLLNHKWRRDQLPQNLPFFLLQHHLALSHVWLSHVWPGHARPSLLFLGPQVLSALRPRHAYSQGTLSPSTYVGGEKTTR